MGLHELEPVPVPVPVSDHLHADESPCFGNRLEILRLTADHRPTPPPIDCRVGEKIFLTKYIVPMEDIQKFNLIYVTNDRFLLYIVVSMLEREQPDQGKINKNQIHRQVGIVPDGSSCPNLPPPNSHWPRLSESVRKLLWYTKPDSRSSTFSRNHPRPTELEKYRFYAVFHVLAMVSSLITLSLRHLVSTAPPQSSTSSSVLISLS